MFRFPRTIFVERNNMHQQMLHIESEVVEVREALVKGQGHVRVAEELVDLIHSAESGLRILQELHGINIDDIWLMVSSKNHQRGYYSR